jgi:3-phosphoshikimate 1-carboxyvinyltransferase
MSSPDAKSLRIQGRPRVFYGAIRLPPSKSYLHRALFVSTLALGKSTISNCGTELNDDIRATISALSSLGCVVARTTSKGGTITLTPGFKGPTYLTLNAVGSGTTARFLIPFSSLSTKGTVVKIVGNQSLSKRPMDYLFEPLSQLGVIAKSQHGDGRLPVIVEGGGIEGGECVVDGSISSQFVSSLLISCLASRRKSIIKIKDPKQQVSSPYIDATICVMRSFGFKIRAHKIDEEYYESFEIPAKQSIRGKKFVVPGDMSSCAALVGAVIATNGKIKITNVGSERFPQPDSRIIPLARLFGASAATKEKSITLVSHQQANYDPLELDMKKSPDLVPAVAGLAAATGSMIKIKNIGHLRFKESDRIKILSRELSKIGIRTKETEASLEVDGSTTNVVEGTKLISPEGDHRMFMALTIAGLSGRFGEIFIEDPNCVKKSYPSFISDLQKLCHEKSTLRLVNTGMSV